MNKIKNVFKKLGNKILDIVFPINNKCIFCNEEIVDFEITPYCENCEKEAFNNENKCVKCDTQIKQGNIICDSCQKHKRSFIKCYCPLNYQDDVRKSIIRFKDDNATYLAKSYAKLIFDYINKENINFDLITFVPSHKTKIKQRGYNPAQILAKELGLLYNKPVIETLAKVSITQAQKTLTFANRQENLKNSMVVINSKAIKNKTILIVDDIITTCATIDCCCNLLKTYTKNLYACAIARNHIFKNDGNKDLIKKEIVEI